MHREGLNLAYALADVRAIASGLEAVASVLVQSAQSNQVERATRLLGAAKALRTRVSIPLEEVDRPDYENCIAVARTALSSAAFMPPGQKGKP
jgi:hypothetical protein